MLSVVVADVGRTERSSSAKLVRPRLNWVAHLLTVANDGAESFLNSFQLSFNVCRRIVFQMQVITERYSILYSTNLAEKISFYFIQ